VGEAPDRSRAARTLLNRANSAFLVSFMTRTSSSDLTRTTLGVLFICVLIAGCLWVMRPFLSSLLWATMIVIATWPFFLKLLS
jgi:predicted PurR-regulated permease PerM